MTRELNARFTALFKRANPSGTCDDRQAFLDTIAALPDGVKVEQVYEALAWAHGERHVNAQLQKPHRSIPRHEREKAARTVNALRRDVSAFLRLHDRFNPDGLDDPYAASWRHALASLDSNPIVAYMITTRARRGAPERAWLPAAKRMLKDAGVKAITRRDLLHQLALIPSGQ